MDFLLVENNKSYVYDTFCLVWVCLEAETWIKTWVEVVYLGDNSRKQSGEQRGEMGKEEKPSETWRCSIIAAGAGAWLLQDLLASPMKDGPLGHFSTGSWPLH